MPEGDTLRRTALGLRPYLVGRVVTRARARQPGPRAELLVGSAVLSVESIGKHLIVRFDRGPTAAELALRTHLGLHGTWHRYRPGERWRRAESRARIVIEVEGAVAVCFDAPTVELLESRSLRLASQLGGLGPDLIEPAAGGPDGADDVAEAVRRLREPSRRDLPIAEALLDQRALAGIGNVYKSEVLFVERVHPFDRVSDLPDATLERLVRSARRLLRDNVARARRRTTGSDPAAAGGSLWVYGRGDRRCRRCGAHLAQVRHGELPRRTTWCPRCQPAVGAGSQDA